MPAELRELARGRWREILPILGLPVERLNGRHGPCPLCGQGKDRFRFDDKDGYGTWICNQCRAGDGISFVQKMYKVKFRDAADLIRPLIGAPATRMAAPIRDDESTRRWLNRTWAEASPIVADDPVGRFLRARTGIADYPRVLRYHPCLKYYDRSREQSYHPAMLAIISDASGKPASIHRTYLRPDGSKADVAVPRQLMPLSIPDGAAIRLSEPAETLGIAEGIETALAASVLTGIPCWSALNTTTLVKWTPPQGVLKIVIFGDNDENSAGQAAAHALAKSLKCSGFAEVDVRIPAIRGDWNDVLLDRRPRP